MLFLDEKEMELLHEKQTDKLRKAEKKTTPGTPKTTRIAVIGSGISGISAVHTLLKNRHVQDAPSPVSIDVYEAEAEVGGHTRTISIPDYGNAELGFQVCNRSTYPNYLRFLLSDLRMELQDSDMSFSFTSRFFTWSSNAGALLMTVLHHLVFQLSLGILGFFRTMARFHADARRFVADVEAGRRADVPLATFLQEQEAAARGYSRLFVDGYLWPFCMSVWSCGFQSMREVSSYAVFVFMANHGLLDFWKLDWYTTIGFAGDPRVTNYKAKWLAYVDRMQKRFPNVRVNVLTNARVERIVTVAPATVKSSSVKRVIVADDGCDLGSKGIDKDGTYDVVVIASPCHTLHPLLRDMNTVPASVTDALKSFTSTESDIVVHSDKRLMPASRRNWAAWNAVYYDGDEDDGTRSEEDKSALSERLPTLSYWSNRLLMRDQSEHSKIPQVFITLNPPASALQAPGFNTLHRIKLAHPLLNPAYTRVFKAEHLPLYEREGIYVAGAYLGYGFHEDGFVSGMEAARKIVRNHFLTAAAPLNNEQTSTVSTDSPVHLNSDEDRNRGAYREQTDSLFFLSPIAALLHHSLLRLSSVCSSARASV